MKPDSSRQGQAQEFAILTLDFFYGLRMTQGYELNHSISQRLLKYFFEHVGLIHVLPLAVHLFFFCAEQVEGVILSHFYTLGFSIRDLLHA